MWGLLLSALLGALVGGMLSVLGVILFERHKRWLDASAVTTAIGAEIKTLVSIFESRGYLGEVDRLLSEFREDKRRRATLEIQFPDEPFPIYRANLDKIGLLPPSMIADVVKFYALIDSAILEVRPGGLLAANECDEAAFAKFHEVATEAVRTGKRVCAGVPELGAAALPSR